MTLLNERSRTHLDHVLSSQEERFDRLIEIAGLDPSRDLRFADLREVDFAGSVLLGWDFTGADLDGASFRDAHIANCVFKDAIGVDLTGAIELHIGAHAIERGPPGRRAGISVQRALLEFRAGRSILTVDQGEPQLFQPVDGIDAERLADFRALCAPAKPYLLVTARRARALGLDAAGPVGLAINDVDNATDILSLATDTQVTRRLDVVPVGSSAGAAIELAKLARLFPALLIADGKTAATSADPPLIRISADAVARYRQAEIDSLRVAADATIPLNSGFPARFVIFRDWMGATQIAVVVGTLDLAQPVPVRLHSACPPGEIFGSRRCDCGDQLRLGLVQLGRQGGGIILYLEQEGRGLGLANQIRTYQLQDAGTVDANMVLGFDDDERDYHVAVRMLQILGCTRVRLMTNNPSKLESLSDAGIEVSGRIPLDGQINSDNRRYLTAKATRAGHKLDHVLGALSDAIDGTIGSETRPAVGQQSGGGGTEGS